MNVFVAALLCLVTSIMTGCVGPVVSLMREPSVTMGEVKNADPLKISAKEAGTIKSVAVLSEAEFIEKIDPQSRLLYKYCMDIITSKLDQSKRFKVIYPTVFMKKANALNVSLDPIKVTDAEFANGITEVAKSVKADAVVRLDIKANKMNMAGNFAQYAFLGAIDVPMTTVLQVLPGSKGSKDVLWVQEEEVKLTAGSMGLKNLPPEEMKKMAATIVNPLVTDLLKVFGSKVVVNVAPEDEKVENPPPAPAKAVAETNERKNQVSSEPVAKQTQTTSESKAIPTSTVVKITKAKLRTSPSSKSKIIKTLKKGTEVQIVKAKDEWCLIELKGGETGWCLRDSLSETK